MNFIEGTLLEKDGSLLLDVEAYSIRIPSKYRDQLKEYIGKNIVLGVRPQNIIIGARSSEGYTARVTGCELTGTETIIHFTIKGDIDYTAVIPSRVKISIGDEITWKPDEDHLYFFDKKTQKAIY
ncbi:MAG: TOBE domain-containing protein [Desulfurococcus sp.]|nr:TOBE domain-containing protein [Desulfurococcus sp.]